MHTKQNTRNWVKLYIVGYAALLPPTIMVVDDLIRCRAAAASNQAIFTAHTHSQWLSLCKHSGSGSRKGNADDWVVWGWWWWFPGSSIRAKKRQSGISLSLHMFLVFTFLSLYVYALFRVYQKHTHRVYIFSGTSGLTSLGLVSLTQFFCPK